MRRLCIWIYLWIVNFAAAYEVQVPPEEQQQLIVNKHIECLRTLNTSQETVPGVFCPGTWDNAMCWPDTPAGTVTSQPCASYINKFKTEEFATRECFPNGTWYSPNENGNHNGWTNFTDCLSWSNAANRPAYPKDKHEVVNMVSRHIDAFRMMYNIGFAVSLVSLMLAVFIILVFRKLHCARNYIHLNLFMSFLLRAAMNIIRENMWKHNLGFPKDVHVTANGTISFTDGPHWECRMFYTIYQYVLMSSYLWIFIEAFYLHMLIFVAVFTEKTRVLWYMLLGWSLPLPCVVSWAIGRALMDNTFCWNTSTNSPGLVWVNKTPVMISVILNFLFFINIVRLLFTKLNSFPEATRYRYKRLARSILVLIPIFGVYYIVFTVIPVESLPPTASFVMLFIEMFFNSYQGLFIAILLCFVNAEVRSEIRKAWNRHNIRRSSTVSKCSHSHGDNRSSGGRMSDTWRPNVFKKYKVGGKSTTSLTNLEESVPFTNTSVKTYSVVMNGNQIDEALASDNELPKTDDVELKIKFVNIECKSRDGMSKNTTSLDIQTLKNGCTINEAKLLNNNIDDQDNIVKSDPDNATKSEDEAVFFLDAKG